MPTNLSNQVPLATCEQNFNKGLSLNSRLPEKANYLTKSEKIAILKTLSSKESAELNILNEEKIDTNSPYIEEDGKVYREVNGKDDDKKYLANFTVLPLEDITIDNGQEVSREFVVKGKLCTGESLKTIHIPAEQFQSMNWISKNWGLSPRIAVGSTNKDYFRDYIQSRAEDMIAKTIYAHTGFKTIEDKLCFLSSKNVIGNESAICKLEGDLSKYRFIDKAGISKRDALNAVLDLFNLAPPEISYPLLSVTYLAPLNHFLTKIGISPSFSLFCKGETGSFKTVISMLYLSHFMEYSGMTESPPANFHSTSNAIEKMAFTLKDALLLVDDYHPTTAQDKKRMDSICQRLARGAGDHLARARMTSDIKLRASYSPRSLVIITGEDIPDIGQSGLSRFYFVDFKKGIIDKSKLTTIQNNAHLLNVGMQFYIEWLIAHSDTLCEKLKEIFNHFKKFTDMNDCHARMIPMLSWLGIGISVFCSFMEENEIFTETEVDEFCNNAFEVFKNSCVEQSNLQKEETPTVIFLTVINELLASDKKNVQTVDTGMSTVSEKFLGYQDNDFIYFFPEITFSAVIEFLRKQDRIFPVSRTRLFNDLAKENLIITDKGRRTFSKRVNGKVQRFLAIKKEAFNLAGGEQNEILDTKTIF